MLFANIGIIDENFEYVAGQWVGVADGKIDYIGGEEPADAAKYGEVYDGTDKLLMPGLYNAHAHAPMTLLRGYAENLPLQAWLEQKCWPFEGKMTGEDNYWATLLAGAEMLRYGVVSFSDMYYHTPERARAVDELGMKANLCTSPLAFEPKPIQEFPVFAEMEDGINNIDGMANGRIRFEGCIHAEYTNNDVCAKSVFDWAKQHNTRMHVHVSETKSEVADCRERHDGMSPVQWLESLGAFDMPAIAAHCVWVDDDDIAILAKHGVTVAHNPASNMKLSSGFAPVAKMIEAGVNVALGTDGMASNNNHDMFQDMYLMAMLPKGNMLDPTFITPQEALRSATRAGALAQGREDCGLVKEGFAADLCVLDVSGPSWCPANDVPTNVVYAGHGSDVVLTMCDGAVVYRDGVWPGVDIDRVKAEVVERTQRIQAELAAE
ncbi:MAG: amidohydrolase [Eggerthellaceae bacterium]|nr:amidohydrolase [Eggerthellaceae bacterium]